MVSNIVKLAKIALADVDRAKVVALIDCINLTNQEKEIVIKTDCVKVQFYFTDKETTLQKKINTLHYH